ncbi:hypothetical protein ASZ78_006634 [Callipepla squamata]|uniref:Dentin matrix acidic phosphoprotein 1 n=1 Tax=Callipepla squamata TaxID=9009 RepID=A0A226NF87_CALSU|nr:hypothetical protein ASZ78_006634 [Callipepla squamata]
MKAVLLMLLLWAAARAHPVPGYLSMSQDPEGAAPGDVANALGPLPGDEDLRASMGPWDIGDGDVAMGNHVERDLAGHNGLPTWPGDEEDDSGDDTFDGDKEESEGPAYGTGDTGGHGDSSSSSSSESAMAPRRHIRYRGGSRWGGGSSSSQEDDEERVGLGGEGMQGDDPSVFDSLGGGRHGQRTSGSPWEDEDSHSPETEDTNSVEDSEEKSHSQENSEASRSREDGDSPSQEDGDSPSREDEDSPSQEDGDSPSQEDGDSPSQEDGDSPSREDEDSPSQEASDEESAEDGSEEAMNAPQGRSSKEEQVSAEDRSAVSDLDTEEEQSSASTESQSSSPEGSQEDSEEDDDDDDDDDEQSQETTSRGDANSLRSLKNHRRRPGAYHRKQAAELDDNDCQDGY